MSMRTPVIAGNWKMYKTAAQAAETIRALRGLLETVDGVEVVICPPFIALAAGVEAAQGSAIRVGAQDCHWEKEGAFTGEVAVPMIAALGCTHVIVGHSERRQLFGETDASVDKKTAAVLAAGLTCIACIGETLAEREAGQTLAVLERQVRGGLAAHLASPRLVIAYEPVWAIGTGKTATPAQAQEAHVFVRQLVARMAGSAVADRIRMLYGGSVKPDNIVSLMAQPDVDGGLVGGASLDAGSFAKIVSGARTTSAT
jgi:triosephosphate isomerase